MKFITEPWFIIFTVICWTWFSMIIGYNFGRRVEKWKTNQNGN